MEGISCVRNIGQNRSKSYVFSPAQRPKIWCFDRFWPISYLLDDIVGLWESFSEIWLIRKFLSILKRSKTKYWVYIVYVYLIFQSNVKYKMKKFLKIEKSIQNSTVDLVTFPSNFPNFQNVVIQSVLNIFEFPLDNLIRTTIRSIRPDGFSSFDFSIEKLLIFMQIVLIFFYESHRHTVSILTPDLTFSE